MKVTIGRHALDRATYIDHETDDVLALIARELPVWPKGARIFDAGVDSISDANDVTPKRGDDISVARLATLQGPVTVLVFPEEPISLTNIIINLVIAAALTAVSAVLRKKPTVPRTGSGAGSTLGSPNNALVGRTNQARPNGRIPDIFGYVRSVPDLIGQPLSRFINHREVEVSDLCIGRGSYAIDHLSVKDGTTQVQQIEGTSIEIYGPNTSANSGDAPQLLIGDAIGGPITTNLKVDGVNGLTLDPPGPYRVRPADGGSGRLRGVFPNAVQLNESVYDADLTELYRPGDPLQLAGFDYSVVVGPDTFTGNLNGTYTIDVVLDNMITLVAPELVNPDWLLLASLPGTVTNWITEAELNAINLNRFTGYFFVGETSATTVIANFIAQGGLYQVDADGLQRGINVGCIIEVLPANADGNPTGAPPQAFGDTIYGSAVRKDQRAVTIEATPAFSPPWLIRARRVSDFHEAGGVTFVEDVQWRDLYVLSPMQAAHYGDVTTVRARTVASPAALALKERKLNMMVTRKVPIRVGENTFSAPASSRHAAEIFCAIALDPKLGARTTAEMNFAEIYDAVAAAATNFGTADAISFDYTFDEDMSPEDMLKAVAQSVHCEDYRRGNKIGLMFEKKTDLSTLLLGHRNKVPRSETRTIAFGEQGEFDGVEVQYVDPKDDTMATFTLPASPIPARPKKIDMPGLRGRFRAHFHAWRAYLKLLHQRETVEFTALPISDILARNERILVADNTDAATMDGDIEAQAGTQLILSQRHAFEPGTNYTIFLGLSDATVQAIGITATAPNVVVLDELPSLPLVTSLGQRMRTKYTIIADDDPDRRAYLVLEKQPQGDFNVKIKAANYDARFYEHDTDYLEGVIDANGNPI